MTFMVAMGFSVAAMIRVGNQKGLKRFRELRRIAFSILLLSTLLATVFAVLFLVFNEVFPKLYLDYDNPEKFVDNLEVASIAAKLLIIAAIFQISDTIQVVILGALRGKTNFVHDWKGALERGGRAKPLPQFTFRGILQDYGC